MNQDFMSNPAIQKTLQGISGWRANFVNWLSDTRELRAMVAANQDLDPAAAAQLIALLDQRLVLIPEMIEATDRMLAIISSAGQVSHQPTEELSALLAKSISDQRILRSLIEESGKIAPGAARKGWVN